MNRLLASNKGLIEIIGFLVATGALFLNIPLSDESTAAAKAMANVQLFWLVVIIGCLLVMGVKAILNAAQFEGWLIKEKKLDIEAGASFILLFACVFLLVNLITYTWNSYARSILEVADDNLLGLGIFTTLFTTWTALEKSLLQTYFNSFSGVFITLVSVCVIAIWSGLMSIGPNEVLLQDFWIGFSFMLFVLMTSHLFFLLKKKSSWRIATFIISSVVCIVLIHYLK